MPNIKSFETVDDITKYLKEQFAGLFKQFIIDNKRIKETLIIRDIENTARTLREMIDYLRAENHDKDETLNLFVKINHPIIGCIKKALSINYNIYIEGKKDLESILRSRGYSYNTSQDWWERKHPQNGILTIKVSDKLFETDGSLKYIKSSDWKDEYLSFKTMPQPEDDDLPF